MYQGDKFVPGYNHKFLKIKEQRNNSNVLQKIENDNQEIEKPNIFKEIIKEFYGDQSKVEDDGIQKLQENVALDFLEECSYSIDLKYLYRLRDDSSISGTCAYNQDMEYVPVQIQISNDSKSLYGNNNWLLQVWDSKGIKRFEESMKYEVSQWAICFEYFIFKTKKTKDSNDESNYFQIRNLNDGSRTLVEDFIQDQSYKYFAYNNGKFYAANSEKIKVAAVKLTKRSGFTVKRKINTKNVATITLWDSEKEKRDIHQQHKGKYGQKIHGLAVTSEGLGSDNKKDFIYVFLEIFGRGGNRLSMNELTVDINLLPPYHDHQVEGSINEKKQFYYFTESREFLFVGQESGEEDPIINYQFIFKKDNIHVGVAQRESKQFDIYFNGNWIDDASEVDENGKKTYKKCESFQVTYTQIFFEHLDDNKKPFFKTLNHNLYYDNAKLIQGSLLSSNLFFTERIKNHVRLFSGVIVIETNIFVSHGRHVSQYYLEKNKFILRKKHFSFKYDVKFMFKIMSKDLVTGLDKFSVGILLEKGQFKILKADDNTDFNQWEEHIFENVENIPGEIISCSNDPVQYKCNLFLANIKNKKVVQNAEVPQQQNIDEVRAYIFNGKSHDITEQLNRLGVQLDIDDQMVGMYEKDLLDPFFIYYQCKLKKIVLFKCSFRNTLINWEKNHLNVIELQENKNIQILKVSEINFSPMNIIKNEYDYKLDSKRQVWQDIDQKSFKINSAVVHHNFLLIFSNVNCYKISIEKDQQLVKDSINLIPELCWKTFYISNMKSIYLIMDQEDKAQKGVCYFDLERFLDQKKDQNKKFKDLATWLQFAQIGIQSCVDYGQGIERLAYIKSYQEINLIPNLHLNQVSLIDQKNYEEYLAVRSNKDAFYAILNEKDTYFPDDPDKMVSTLITWDIVTGKKKHSNRCDMLKGNYDFTNYERFKPKNFEMQLNGLYERTLLVEKNPQVMNENQLEQFFDQESLKPMFPNQIRYVKSERDAKQIYKFQMIQIIDSDTIEQQYIFLHPKYNEQQAIYINQNNDKMIEWLSNDRVTFYDRIDEETEKNSVQKIRWIKIRRMQNLYTIYGRPDYLINVSSDFRLFIDVKKAQKQFIIRDMYTEEEITKIPHYLMNYEKDPLETMLRVKWIGNDAIKIINDEGMEKIFEISANAGSEYKQLGYNQNCNYNYEIENSRNFYFDRKELNTIDVTERLIRKCQNYKSFTFLSEVEFFNEEKSMYECLFTIDYQATRNITKKFFTDMSFSFITWKNIEELRDGELQIEDLDDESIKKICFTILPGGLTFLHILYRKPKIIEKIFQKALFAQNDLKNLKYSIPFLQNMNGNCPIEYSIEGDEYITINLFLKYLASQPIDHHSRQISKHLSKFLELSLSNFVYYVKNLKKQNKLISEFTREGINEENPTECITITDLWTQKSMIKQKMFSDNAKGSDIQLFYTDLVQIHEFNQVSQEFFEAMSQTEELELFDQLQIQNLINFKWPIVKQHILLYAVFPAVGYLLSTFLYTSLQFIYHDRMVGNKPDVQGLNWIVKTVCEELILIFSLYFLSLESLQIKQDPINYFLSFWNYMDIIPPVFQIGLAIYNFYDVQIEIGKLSAESQQINAVVMSITTLCLWIKFLYFLRIFDATGFLVRSIIFCIQEMKYFLLILLVTICAFADSYKVMSYANFNETEMNILKIDIDEKKPEQFVEGNFIKSVFYAYLIGLGEFPLDSEFGKIAPLYCNILFVLNTLITTIIMLNLFIAIISNAFDKINQQGIKASYREKAGLISENEFLISADNRNSWVEQGKYLLFVQDINQIPIEDTTENQ